MMVTWEDQLNGIPLPVYTPSRSFKATRFCRDMRQLYKNGGPELPIDIWENIAKRIPSDDLISFSRVSIMIQEASYAEMMKREDDGHCFICNGSGGVGYDSYSPCNGCGQYGETNYW